MAKVALAGGHSRKAPGASGYINEYVEDRRVNNALIAEMKRRGHTAKNCSNEASTVNSELASEVNSANKSGAKIFCATHFNAFKTTSGKRGVECWYYTGDATGKKVATAMAKNLSSLLGLPNRGAKATTQLYVIAYTDMTAVLPEVCFVDAKGDTSAYNSKTAAKIASAMADALEIATGKGKQQAKKLLQCAEDGYWGARTTRVWQAINGIEESGKILRQLPGSKAHLKACTSSKLASPSFVFAESDKAAKTGSLAIKRLQNRKLGIPWSECTGWMDAKTRKLFVAKYYGKGYTTTDLLAPSKAVKAFQREINREAKKLGIKR